MSSSANSPESTPRPMRSAWIVAFGPVGGSLDGYVVRVEGNARALASLGFGVHILEISTRRANTEPWTNVETVPAFPRIVANRKLLGPIDLIADFRAQIALAVGLVRHWTAMRRADVVVVEGGLHTLAFALKMVPGRHRPKMVFDLITLMSDLHRDAGSRCTVACKARRAVWRMLEWICASSADLSVAGSAEDARGLRAGRATVLPHALIADPSASRTGEDPHLLGFLGSGHVVPNRQAIEFIATTVLCSSALEAMRCRVIGDPEGYPTNSRLEFVGFHQDTGAQLAPVSVACAPMDGAGGVSTKVLTYLMHGKRTVCTPEAARGVAAPPEGLWIATRPQFPTAVAAALAYPWSGTSARSLRDWMDEHHGLGRLRSAWAETLRATSESTSQIGDHAMRHSVDDETSVRS